MLRLDSMVKVSCLIAKVKERVKGKAWSKGLNIKGQD